MPMRLLLLILCLSFASSSKSSKSSLSSRKSLRDPPLVRAKRLLSKMTVKEKIAQTFAAHTNEQSVRQFLKSGVGASKYMSALSCGSNVTKCVMERNQLQRDFLNLTGIPISFINEGLHGGAEYGTIFPMPINQGCSFNVTLVEKIASVIAKEASAVGVDTVFAPVVNMITDARFGRMQEGFSENPVLSTRMGVASVRGLQGKQLGEEDYVQSDKVISLGKHFAAYGQPAGGLNGGSADMTSLDLHDIFLRPWREMAKEGLGALMPAHNTVDGIPCHGNAYLLNDMRAKFGFNGIMLSDCNDIGVLMDYRFAANRSHAAALALKAGLDWDLQCGYDNSAWGFNALNESLDDGLVSESDLDSTVMRILTHKFRVGLFDERGTIDPTHISLDSKEHRDLAREAAEQSMVMLLNRDQTLPIDFFTTSSSVALIGPSISKACKCKEATESLMGSYYLSGSNVVTLDEAFASKFPNTNVTWAQGTRNFSGPTLSQIQNETLLRESVSLAENSDLTIMILGDLDAAGCGEWGDRDELTLQGDQLALLDAVSKVSKKTILILVHGRPQTFGLDSDRVLSQLDALYAAFRPGEEFGNAMLNLLSGTVNPSAKLSNTWPRLASHTSSNFLQRVRGKWIANEKGVMDPDGRRFDSYSASNVLPTPLFYFGYGMSYSTFLYTNLEVNLESDGGLSVMVDVKNAGKYDGVEVVQVYIMDPSGVLPYTPFWKRLVGFSRCFVGTGKTSSCHVTVMKSDLEVYDPRTRDYRVFGGVYTVRVGGSSHSDSLTKAIRMGETMNHHSEF